MGSYLVVLAAALGATVACAAGDPVGPPIITPEPLPTTPMSPAVPGASHVYIANADGTGIVRLTVGDRPAWSPDGRRIAYELGGAVRVLALDGTSDTRVATGWAPAWSPDGSTIAYTNADGIGLVTPNGVRGRTIVRHDFNLDTDPASDMGVSKAAWSPDGKLIAFEHLGDGDLQPAQVFAIAVDGSNTPRRVTQLTNRRYAESDPSWSPDGLRIVYWSFGYGIAATVATGGLPNTVYADFPRVVYGTKPVWSPRGLIAFTQNPVSSLSPAIWTVSATGDAATARQLIANAHNPAWSPSGARIAFASRRSD